jgi:predicted ATPase
MAKPNLNSILRRVAVKDYRSIAICDVQLEPLMFLVGPNGSGKSNFLDALRFVSDSLRVTVEQALRDRGGIQEVRRRSEGHPNHMQIYLEGELAQSIKFRYGFEIGARTGGGFRVRSELCQITGPKTGTEDAYYEVADGAVVRSSIRNPPAVSDERLFLTHASGYPFFKQVYEVLSGLGFYNLNPQSIRELQSPDSGERLSRDGGNLAAVVRNLSKQTQNRRERILEYMKMIVPGLDDVKAKTLGPKETLEFEEKSITTGRSRKFFAANMSDGTLRALGVLAALFQSAHAHDLMPPVAVEEPEMALHPAAAGVLFDALLEASFSRQVLVTSHSPDLLDRPNIPPESILAVLNQNGRTVIAPIEPGEREALSHQLRTVGELLRIDQLRPDLEKVPKYGNLQLPLFTEK